VPLSDDDEHLNQHGALHIQVIHSQQKKRTIRIQYQNCQSYFLFGTAAANPSLARPTIHRLTKPIPNKNQQTKK
jgi:hypothetical protein